MQRAGADVPALNTRPDISGLEWLWGAFQDLATCRSIGFSVGPIPWTAIDQYSRSEELSAYERRMLIAVVRSMDSAYLKHEAAKQKKAAAQSKAKAKKGR